MPERVHESDLVTQVVVGSPLLLARTRKVPIGEPPKDRGSRQLTSKDPRVACTVTPPGALGALPALTGSMTVEKGKRLPPPIDGADPMASQPPGEHATAESWGCIERDPRTSGASAIAGGDH